MTTLKNLLFAGALGAAVLATPAYAENNTFNLGTIPAGTTVARQSPHTTQGTFTDTFNFSLAGGGGDGGFAYFNFASRFSNIANAVLTLTGPTALTRSLFDGYEETLFLAAGSYTATIAGDANGIAGGSYTLGITAPTPEPEIWLSLAAGAGMAGFMARRRRKQAAKA